MPEKFYYHKETTMIAGTPYYLLKTTEADSDGLDLEVDGGNTGYYAWGSFVFPLTDLAKFYRTFLRSRYNLKVSDAKLQIKASLSIHILKADGTRRETIASYVCSTSIFNNEAAFFGVWSATDYPFAEYVIIDETDYLEVELICQVIQKKAGSTAWIRIDDSGEAAEDFVRTAFWDYADENAIEASPTGQGTYQYWTNPMNAQAPDDVYAEATETDKYQDYTFTPNVPAGEIDKVFVKFEHKEGTQHWYVDWIGVRCDYTPAPPAESKQHSGSLLNPGIF